MEYLILGVAALAAAFTMAIKKNPVLSLLGQASLLVMVLGVGAGMAYCVYYPATTGADDGIITLAIFPLFIVGLIPWGLWETARKINKDRRKSPEEKSNIQSGIQGAAPIDLQNLSDADKALLQQNIKHDHLTSGILKIAEAFNKKPL